MSITPEAQVQSQELDQSHPQKRMVVKFPGQVFGRIDACPELTGEVARQISIAVARQPHLELVVVVGGSNICHGASLAERGASMGAADRIGLGATIQNGLLLHDQLRRRGVDARIYTSFPYGSIEMYCADRVERQLAKDRVVVLAGGLGHGGLSSSFAAVTQAHQLQAAELVVARVGADGIFDRDPAEPGAKLLDHTSHDAVAKMGLAVIDGVALKQASAYHLPIRVFGMTGRESIVKAIIEGKGTIITNPFDFGPLQ